MITRLNPARRRIAVLSSQASRLYNNSPRTIGYAMESYARQLQETGGFGGGGNPESSVKINTIVAPGQNPCYNEGQHRKVCEGSVASQWDSHSYQAAPEG
jgi:hypothetical protein